jgi:hypothetical protein
MVVNLKVAGLAPGSTVLELRTQQAWADTGQGSSYRPGSPWFNFVGNCQLQPFWPIDASNQRLKEEEEEEEKVFVVAAGPNEN